MLPDLIKVQRSLSACTKHALDRDLFILGSLLSATPKALRYLNATAHIDGP
jgi:hypothetical protein